MTFVKRFLSTTVFCALLLSSQVGLAFKISSIVIRGNQRVSTAAALAHLPVKRGQDFTDKDSNKLIQALHRTGNYSDIQLYREGRVLVIQVKERPIISQITFSGNKDISSKQLKPVMKHLGVRVGDIYQPSKLTELKQGMEAGYKTMGRQGVVISTRVTPHPYNTVSIDVSVDEGVVSKIKSISFTGNHVFTAHRLKGLMTLTTSGLLTFLTKKDHYSQYQLDQDLDKIHEYYFDHGYLQFKVLSKHIKMSPNHKRVDIAVSVHEGPVFRVSSVQLTGKVAQDNPIIRRALNFKSNEVFSRTKVMQSSKSIQNYLANKGYALAKVVPVPHLNEQSKTVSITFQVKPGHRMYVRHVLLAGNQRTEDRVLRTQMRQLEASIYSLKKITESKRLLANLPYFTNIRVEPIAVPGNPDQIDLKYHVDEVSAGRASIQGGYSDTNGFLYGASISEPNFLGSGKFASISFQNSRFAQDYSISYTNPFYTTYGMSRSMSVYYNKTTPGKVDLDPYTTNTYGASLNYSLPVTAYDYLTFGGSYNHISINNVNPKLVSPSVYVFLQHYPSPYSQVIMNGGYVHSYLDRAIFPTKGNIQRLTVSLGVPVSDSSLAYYKATYDGKWYFPVGHSGFVINPHISLGYGDGYSDVNSLPFTQNFYGGGIGTLLGYSPNSLGPKNPNQAGSVTGGNVMTFDSVNLILPNFVSDRVRVGLFVGMGNVFQTHHTQGNPGNPDGDSTSYEKISLKNLRGAYGIKVSWFSPMGIITLGYGIPFNHQKGDELSGFGFTFGASL